MATKQVKNVTIHNDSVYDDFSRFALNHKDAYGQPFFIIVDGQIVQNYKCNTRADKLAEDYRNKLAQGKKIAKKK